VSLDNLSFDDPDDELNVFSAYDLVLSYRDITDLDWGEVAERRLIEQRRGLVVLQATVLEDLIDDFIMYLADAPDQNAYYEKLVKKTMGPRVEKLEDLMKEKGLNDARGKELIERLKRIVERRNLLAHGILQLQPVENVKLPLKKAFELEWVIVDRRSGVSQRLSMLQLRKDFYEVIDCFYLMLSYMDHMLKIAPKPKHFKGGMYLTLPD